MPLGIFRAAEQPNLNRQAELDEILLAHDVDRLQAFDQCLQSGPPLPDFLDLQRAIAAYEDQRGWREKAYNRYIHLLTRYLGSPAVATRLRLDLGDHCLRWGDLAGVKAQITQAAAALPSDSTPTLRGAVLRSRGLLAAINNDLPQAESLLRQALELFQEKKDWAGRALVLNTLSYAYLLAGRFPEAEACTSSALAGTFTDLKPALQADLLSNHASALRQVKAPADALPFAQQTLDLHVQRRDPLNIANSSSNLAALTLALGRLPETRTILQKALDLLLAENLEDFAGPIYNSLGMLHRFRSDLPAAIQAFTRAAQIAERNGQLPRLAISAANLGEVYTRWGDHASASTWLERSAEAYAGLDSRARAIDQYIQAARLTWWLASESFYAVLWRALKVASIDEEKNGLSKRLALKVNNEFEELGYRARPDPDPEALWVPPLTPEEAQHARDGLERLVLEFLQLVSSPEGDAARLAQIFQDVNSLAKKVGSEALNAALRRLTVALRGDEIPTIQPVKIPGNRPGVDTSRGASIAFLCGVLVEAGGDASISASATLDILEATLPLANDFLQACRNFAQNQGDGNLEDAIERYGPGLALALPAHARGWNSLEQLGPACVTMLSRSGAERRAARARPALRTRLDLLSLAHPATDDLLDLLYILDDEELLVLHASLNQGYRVRISGISSNFQLHTLLADALAGDPASGKLPFAPPVAEVVAAERGTLIPHLALTATGVFNMVTWRALLPDAAFNTDLDTWIWGEDTPADIPIFEGRRVVLISTPPYGRSWTTGGRFGGMVAECVLEEILELAEVRALLDRMVKANEKKV